MKSWNSKLLNKHSGWSFLSCRCSHQWNAHISSQHPVWGELWCKHVHLCAFYWPHWLSNISNLLWCRLLPCGNTTASRREFCCHIFLEWSMLCKVWNKRNSNAKSTLLHTYGHTLFFSITHTYTRTTKMFQLAGWHFSQSQTTWIGQLPICCVLIAKVIILGLIFIVQRRLPGNKTSAAQYMKYYRKSRLSSRGNNIQKFHEYNPPLSENVMSTCYQATRLS